MPTAEKVDRTLPKGRWNFDEEVTAAFDDMLARSIPQYAVMRAACFSAAAPFVVSGRNIVDLGCSRGEALSKFVQAFGKANRYLGVEVSPPMLDAARARFAPLIESGWVDIRRLDLRQDYPACENCCVTLSVLTLQFVPIEYRQRIVRDVFKRTAPGGCFILVEKLLGASAELDALFVDTYLSLKRENGYTPEQIDRKRLSLEGVLVPVSARWNEELLRGAGFTQVDCFWRWMNFAGWVAVKD